MQDGNTNWQPDPARQPDTPVQSYQGLSSQGPSPIAAPQGNASLPESPRVQAWTRPGTTPSDVQPPVVQPPQYTPPDPATFFQPDERLAPLAALTGQGQNLMTQPPAQSAVPARSRRKKVVAVFAVLAIVLGVTGYTFGLYMPNRPEQIWQVGMTRSGQAFEQFVHDATDAGTGQAYEAARLTGKLELSGKDQKYGGTISSVLSPNKSDNEMRLALKDGQGKDQNVSLKLLSQLPDGAAYPNTFLKYSGLAPLGFDALLPGIRDFENTWISVPSDYVQSLLPVDQTKPASKARLTQKDAAALGKIMTASSREFIFTNDPAKAVLVPRQFIGTEQLEDGLLANHYKVGFHRQHALSFCEALSSRLAAAEAYRKLPGAKGDRTADKKQMLSACKDEFANKIDDKDSLDLWIDKKYKLVRKVRVSDQKNVKNYLEIGHAYKGGDTVPLFLTLHSDAEKYEGRMDMTINRTTNVVTGGMFYRSKGKVPFGVTATMELKPYKGELTVARPAAVVSVAEVLKKLGIDPAHPFQVTPQQTTSATARGHADSVQKALDAERQTDILALQARLEAYYGDKGFYPGLTELNSPEWRLTNMRGLDPEVYSDPLGRRSTFAVNASVGQYGYSASGCGITRSDCQLYRLEARLSDGTIFDVMNKDNM